MNRLIAVLGLVFLAGCGGGEGTSRPRTDDEKVDDQAIAAEINRVLSRVEGIDRLKVRIEVARGYVTLSGPARDEGAAKAACEAAAGVSGVEGVRDLLERPK